VFDTLAKNEGGKFDLILKVDCSKTQNNYPQAPTLGWKKMQRKRGTGKRKGFHPEIGRNEIGNHLATLFSRKSSKKNASGKRGFHKADNLGLEKVLNQGLNHQM